MTGSRSHLHGLAVALGALVAPVGLLALDGELLHLAEVRAALAGELEDLVVDLVEVEAAERALACRRPIILSRASRATPIAPITPLNGGTMICLPRIELKAAATASL